MGIIHRAAEYYSLEVIPRRPWPRAGGSDHDRVGGYTGRMVVQIEALSPIHVGSGDYEVDGWGIYVPFARKNGQVAIPGTSIKGAVRTYAEALSPSCEGGRCTGSELCIGCQIFGARGLQGRVAFGDAEAAGNVNTRPYQMTARWSGGFPGGRRFYRHGRPGPTELPGGRERVEVVPAGTKFESEVFIHGLTEPELGLLLLAMGLGPDGYRFDLKLGGGKNRGLGSVRFSARHGLYLVGRAAYAGPGPAGAGPDLGRLTETAVKAYLASLTSPEGSGVIGNLQAFQRDP